ncbi:cyclin-like protein [Aspergillus venezuelensis]
MASLPPAKRPPPAPSNPVLLAAQEQWLFTNEELARSPSQLDGMSIADENLHRSKGVNFITQVGIMLKLPQPTLATAAVYLHRFFMRFVIADKPERPGIHAYPIAATALFLATKVEENVRRMKELVVAVCRVAQKQPNLVVDEQSKEFWKWRDTILHHEDILLEALCFDLQLEQPYKILYDYICFFGVNDNKHIRNSSWAFLNDSMYTVLCLQFPARIIAAAAFYAAASHCDAAFEDDEYGRAWWEQLDVDITQVRQACTRMAELYESNAQNKHNQYYPTIPSFEDGVEKTRISRPGSTLEAPPDPPSRKRSREPEGDFQDRHHSTQEDASQNGQRSPKRSRVGSDAAAGSFGGDGTSSQPPAASSNSPSSSFSQDRSANGHQPQQNRYQHPLPPTPRTTFSPRRNSETKNVDPIQQRIDQIVSQNSATPPKHSPTKRVPDSYSHRQNQYRDRERERDREDDDRYRDRRSSYSSASARGDRERERERLPPPPSDHRQQPPPPPPEPAPDDEEGGGSEEGEL